MNAWYRRNRFETLEKLCRVCKIGVRIPGDNTCSLEQIADQLIVFRRNDQCSCLAIADLISQTGIGKKSDMSGSGTVQRGKSGNFDTAVTNKLTAEAVNQFFKIYRHPDFRLNC